MVLPAFTSIGGVLATKTAVESTDLGAVLAAADLSIPAVCLDLWAIGRWHVKADELERRVRAVWAERSAVPLTLDTLLGRAHLDPSPPSLRIPATTDGDSIRLTTRQIAWRSADIAQLLVDP